MKHFRPVKALGQSFLTYEPAAAQLVAALDPRPGELVLEVGPGKGALTRHLLGRGCRVLAVEIDARLVQTLRDELGGSGRLELVRADFMEFDLSGYSGLKVIGNLPYNLSSQMLVRLLETPGVWRTAVLTTQREFAQRVLAVPGTKAYGALTVFCDVLAEKRRLFNLAPEYFKPRPDVVSTAFLLAVREQPLFVPADPAGFRRVVRAAFGQRRKTLANSLGAGLGIDKAAAVRLLVKAGLDPAARAETLTPQQFHGLADVAGREPAQTTSR